MQALRAPGLPRAQQPDEPDVFWAVPVVAETYDRDLNEINGFHVTREHAFAALDAAGTAAVAEGNVGGVATA